MLCICIQVYGYMHICRYCIRNIYNQVYCTYPYSQPSSSQRTWNIVGVSLIFEMVEDEELLSSLMTEWANGNEMTWNEQVVHSH